LRSRDLHTELYANKTPDSPVLRLDPQTVPVSFATGGTPLQKFSKAVRPRDVRVLFQQLYKRLRAFL
jgi:hypothetical protein